jgi:hypothetical protein
VGGDHRMHVAGSQGCAWGLTSVGVMAKAMATGMAMARGNS